MFDSGPRAHPFERVQVKTLVLVVVALMAAYVLYHNESFLVNSAAPVWKHYAPFKWWLLGHGLAGVSALVLAPMQFSDRLRARFTKLHRITGRVYVAAAFTLAPLGAWIQYLDEAQGASWTFTVETLMQASLLMITTGIGFVFAMKRMIPQHRQWMTRSYAVALTFLEIRVILGVTGWDTPFNWEIVETVVMVCVGSSILVGDIANQVYELRSMRARPARAQRQAA
ncbi:MAG TPA: DUF2306 domain-containing protein [Stellaceae bacterium]|nr:DUF2306 domain-containing protein [Stellaceae bacterium]